ncbi:hypothetical protein Tsubulata_041854 [Turnera subulata]|uniref:DUF4283 domain-containing protein n=1 Tax=Turnera subulata TaxID=218843 RepID=A0A9Q0J1M4_9ROSI|nr:hypothetical protein Tsubulata_041854 [Turnera subulata]
MSGRIHTLTPQLTEAERGAVVLDEEISVEEPHEVQLSLMGKLWTNRPFNTQDFMRTMKMVWKPVHDLEISQLDSNLFVFQFCHWRDRKRVLENEPWNFDNQLVILIEISGNEQPSEIRLDHAPMCVRVYDVPFNLLKPKPLLRGSFAQGGDAKDYPVMDDDDFLDPRLFQYSDELRASPLHRLQLLHNSGASVTKVKKKLVFKPAGKDIGKQTVPNDDLSPGGLTDEAPTARAEMVHPRHVPNATPEKTWVREEGSVRDSPVGNTVAKAQRIGRTEREDPELDAAILPTDLNVTLIPGLQSPIPLLFGSLTSTILSSLIQLGRPLVETENPVVSGSNDLCLSGVGDKQNLTSPPLVFEQVIPVSPSSVHRGNVPTAIPPVPSLCVTQSGYNAAGPSMPNTKWKRLARLAPVGSGLVVDQGGSAKWKNPCASDGDLSDENEVLSGDW